MGTHSLKIFSPFAGPEGDRQRLCAAEAVSPYRLLRLARVGVSVCCGAVSPSQTLPSHRQGARNETTGSHNEQWLGRRRVIDNRK